MKFNGVEFWNNTMGLNIIPYDTQYKIPQISSYIEYLNNLIPRKTLEKWNKENKFSKGIALIPGEIWWGPYKGQYLVAIDCDNKKAIDEICYHLGFEDINELSKWTIVEQHKDDLTKAHIYIRSTRPIKKKSSDKINNDLANKLDVNDIPAIEVKGRGEHGIMFCSPSVHKDGNSYQIIGTYDPALCNDLENHIDKICRKYGITYLEPDHSVSQAKNKLIPIEELFKSNTKILEGHNRHEALLRIMESLLKRNKEILSLNQIKNLANEWNQIHCDPPLEDKEFEKQWKYALKFIHKMNNENISNTRVLNNDQAKNTETNVIDKIELERELEQKISDKNYFEYIVKSVKKTVKCEDSLIRQILYTCFSSYIQDDPINLGIIAPTTEGKTYPVEECLQYFPREDVYKIGSMSTKVLIRQKGILLDKHGEPIGHKIKELTKKRKLLADNKENKEEILNIVEEIHELFEESKTLIDLRGKILVFLEPPQKEVWEILKPILSHDPLEIEFPFVNQTDKEGHQTKNVIVRGWPSCIFCSAKDESNWPIWPEIKSRFLISSPNMIPKKYKESTKLISLKYGLPNLIQQQIIISESEMDFVKQCILLTKQNITELRSKNKDNGNKISVWIPYAEFLGNELPSNKGTDVRFQKRIFSLLRIVPTIKFNLRKLLVLEGETSVIADLEDLKEVLSITQNFEGIPKFKVDFFNDIFYPCYKSKTEPDSNSDNLKKEDRIAVTTQQLCEFFKAKKEKPISSDNLKKVYLNELINNGIIDYTPSKIHGRRDIYYPLIEPFNDITSRNSDEDSSSLSLSSNLEAFDKVSQKTSIIYEKIITKITETWLFSEVIRLVSHRIDLSHITQPLADYLNEHEQLKLLDMTYTTEEEQQQTSFNPSPDRIDRELVEDESNNSNRITIGQFTKRYTEKPLSTFDNKRRSDIAPVGENKPFLVESINIR